MIVKFNAFMGWMEGYNLFVESNAVSAIWITIKSKKKLIWRRSC